MSDDLVKRLRATASWGYDLPADAATRIEFLEDALLKIHMLGWPAIGETYEMLDGAANRIEKLEAALRGVIAVADRDCPEFREAHAALKGEKKKDD